MSTPRLRHPKALAAATGTLALLGATALAANPVSGATSNGPQIARHIVLYSGLDNPRQLQRLEGGDFLVAEAGHGGSNPDNCFGSGQNKECVGFTGKVTRIRDRVGTHVMSGLLSLAGQDGTFAVGADGASRLPRGPYYAIQSLNHLPPSIPKGQQGRLLAKPVDGPRYPVANITAYEMRHDPDGEGPDSDPYSTLALNNRVLVADAAGDDILSVRNGTVSLWAVLPEYGPKIDAVPTVLTKAPGGNILVGELHSEMKHKAHVWLYNRRGDVIRGWSGFTTVDGVARGGDGSLYVSELFGGVCTFDQIPNCFPGRVVKVAPDGTRTHVNVPFPSGIATSRGKVFVNAFAVAPATGFGGNPAWSGQLWRVFP